MTKILFILGSLREKSLNKQLAKRAEEFLKKADKEVSVEYLEYGDVPFINQDEEFPTPESVARCRAAFAESDGIWIFTPEYNGSYPGQLKNLLDWMSRSFKPNDFASGTAIKEKKMTVSGIGGKRATRLCREKLVDLLTQIRAVVMEGGGEGFAASPEVFSSCVLDLSAEDEKRLSAQADAFLKFIL